MRNDFLGQMSSLATEGHIQEKDDSGVDFVDIALFDQIIWINMSNDTLKE